MLNNKTTVKAKEELINNAKAKFMEDYFKLNQELKRIPTKKGEEYDTIVKEIEIIEHNMECLSTLSELLYNNII